MTLLQWVDDSSIATLQTLRPKYHLWCSNGQMLEEDATWSVLW